jgi:hypothetical protein
MSQSTVTVSGSDGVRLLRRYWVVMIVGLLLGALAGAAMAAAISSGAIARADLQLARDPGDQTGNAQAAARYTTNELAGLTSAQAIDESVAAAGGDVEISWTLIEGSDIVQLRAAGRDEQSVQAALDTLITRYVDERNDEIESRLDDARELLSDQLSEVVRALDRASPEAERALLAERTELRLQLANLDLNSTLANASPRLVSEVTTEMGSAPLATYALLGASLGALLGALAALLWDRSAARVRGALDGIPGDSVSRTVQIRPGDWTAQDGATKSVLVSAVTAATSGRDEHGVLLVPADGTTSVQPVAELMASAAAELGLPATVQQSVRRDVPADLSTRPFDVIAAPADSPTTPIAGAAGFPVVLVVQQGRTRLSEARRAAGVLEDEGLAPRVVLVVDEVGASRPHGPRKA